MKTRSLSLLLLAAAMTTFSCSPKYYASRNRVPDEMPDGGSYTEKVVPVVTKIAPDGQVTLRFYDNMPNVAYISAADFQSIVLPGSTMTVTHTGAGQYTLANADATATVNINDDVFVSDQFEAFTNQMGLLQPGMANVYYDGMPFVRYKSVSYFPLKATTTLDMGAYGIDLHADGKGAVYFPFATLADMYTDLYYHPVGQRSRALGNRPRLQQAPRGPDHPSGRPGGLQLQGAVLRDGPFLRLPGTRPVQ